MSLNSSPPEPSILRLTASQHSETAETSGSSTDPFQRLPNEVLLLIFTHIDAEQLLVCSLVSRRWRLVASDWYLWQLKLLEAISRRWSTIVCPEQPADALPLREPNSMHPKNIYRFLTRYVPHCQQVCGGQEVQDDKEDQLSLREERMSTPPRLFPLMGFVSTWWSQVKSRIFTSSLTIGSCSIATPPLTSQSPKPRFALFGPGFDHCGTNRLFRKMVNTRTKSFEPIDMFTGHMGFGSGITMRLFAQAQQAAMESSICTTLSKTPSNITPNSDSPPRRLQKCLSLPSRRAAASGGPTPVAPLGIHHADFPCHQCSGQHEDFTFDLSYLYSLPAHLNNVFNDQYSRLTVSRLFSHTSEQLSEHEFFTKLQVTEDMRELCRTLDGLVYAMDARESAEQLAHLHFELRAVLRGFPPSLANRIPIVVLYIMPAEDIHLSEEVRSRRKAKMLLQIPNLTANRDSYSGAEYTAAWHDSLLLPISALRLFEFPNPWRLQKCSSNDLKTLIQSIMWLHARYAAATTL